MLSRPGAHVSRRLLPVHTTANDRADNLAQGRAMAQPEGIGFAERLPDGGVTRGGALELIAHTLLRAN
jgi:hypothetical protein